MIPLYMAVPLLDLTMPWNSLHPVDSLGRMPNPRRSGTRLLGGLSTDYDDDSFYLVIRLAPVG
jgi:hypothetical protein